jgi:GTP-binding protein HflX
MHEITEIHDRAIICGLDLPDQPIDLTELEALVEAAGGEVVGQAWQQRGKPDGTLYFGRGKVEEIKALVLAREANVVIVDDELSPRQIRNLEYAIELKVIDRTQLILEIFAQRAQTYEGKLQVEIALLNYSLPRLTGRGAEMSRLGATTPGARTRGAGESKLELMRRDIRRRIRLLREEAREISERRQLLRSGRARRGYPLVVLIGYTNAGKSSLLNALTEANAYSADMLFATLDPTTRVMPLPDGREIALTDTVGFISRLPHMLVQAFHATLEEVVYADLLVHVVDASSPEMAQQMEAVAQVLTELKAAEKPQVIAYNKADLLNQTGPAVDLDPTRPAVWVSALTGQGLDELKQLIADNLGDAPRLVTYRLPHSRGEISAWLFREGEVIEQTYDEAGVVLLVDLQETKIRQVYKLFGILPDEGVSGEDDAR